MDAVSLIIVVEISATSRLARAAFWTKHLNLLTGNNNNNDNDRLTAFDPGQPG